MEYIQNKSHVYVHMIFIFLQNCELDHRNSSPGGNSVLRLALGPKILLAAPLYFWVLKVTKHFHQP